MALKSHKLSPMRILSTSIVLFILVACLLSIPIITHHRKLADDRRNEKVLAIKAVGNMDLQKYIESRFTSTKPLPNDALNALMPFESISLERTPCFGPCPVYKVTFFRSGAATLEVENWRLNQRKTFTGEISGNDFARLTQLTISAKKAARKSKYEGQWTDDYTAIINAVSSDGLWSVSDYGEVSPVEVWVLANVMHDFKERIDWQVGPIYPLKKPN